MRSGSLSEKLGYPIRPCKALPLGGVIARPYVTPRTDSDGQLWHLKRAMGSLRCFELQWGLVRAELEKAVAAHKKGAKIHFVEGGAMAVHKVQKHLKDLKDDNLVLDSQARSPQGGEAVGGLLHDLQVNRAAFIERVGQLRVSVMGALDEVKEMTINEGSRNVDKLIHYMHQALDILNAMNAMVSQEDFATKSLKKSDLLNALGKQGRSAVMAHHPATPLGEEGQKAGATRRTVKVGAAVRKDAGKELAKGRPGGG